MVNYQNSIIYKLCCKDLDVKEIYIGSTTNFKARKCSHKHHSSTDSNRPVYKFIRENGGWDNWDMIQIKTFSCNSKRELYAEERKYIEEYKSVLNFSMPGLSLKESRNKWNNNNKEKLKISREKNKKQKSEYDREYSKKNKEKIKKRMSEKYTCICGMTLTKGCKARHERSNKHILFCKKI